jgi:hypothetical protein
MPVGAKKDSIMNTDRFVRTAKPINYRCAKHNVARWDWIEEAGSKGRTFDEINAPNSKYRKCIKRKSYHGNGSSIRRDVKYDIKNEWIEKI